MGKKNNRLTATTLDLPTVRPFYDVGSDYAPRRGEQNATRHNVRRRRASERQESRWCFWEINVPTLELLRLRCAHLSKQGRHSFTTKMFILTL